MPSSLLVATQESVRVLFVGETYRYARAPDNLEKNVGVGKCGVIQIRNSVIEQLYLLDARRSEFVLHHALQWRVNSCIRSSSKAKKCQLAMHILMLLV